MRKLILIISFINSITLISQNTDFSKKIKRYKIQAVDSKPVKFKPYFKFQNKIDSISKNYDNSHRRSLAIEKFQVENSKTKILIDSISRIVCLKNGKEVKLTPDPMGDEYGYTFEKEFSDSNLLLFRVQWSEGNNYFLLNTLTGNYFYTIGQPKIYKNQIVCINDDIVAEYSFNGIQMFEIQENELIELWKIKIEWAPEDIKWIDDKTLIVKGYNYSDNLDTKSVFYKKLTSGNTM